MNRIARFEAELVALIDERGKIVKRKGEAVEGVGIFDERGRDYAGGFDAKGVAYGADADTDNTILLLDGSRSKFKVGKKYRIAKMNREAVARELVALARELTAIVTVPLTIDKLKKNGFKVDNSGGSYTTLSQEVDDVLYEVKIRWTKDGADAEKVQLRSIPRDGSRSMTKAYTVKGLDDLQSTIAKWWKEKTGQRVARELIAKVPKKGDEVRYKGSDGAMTVDKVHSIDDDWVELNRGDMVKTKDMTFKGKYWLARKIS